MKITPKKLFHNNGVYQVKQKDKIPQTMNRTNATATHQAIINTDKTITINVSLIFDNNTVLLFRYILVLYKK